MNQATTATASDPRQLLLVFAEPPKDFTARAKRPASEGVAALGNDDFNDHRSASYRYADTGYIAGSRKEEAASQVILRAKREGLRVHARAIDWKALETNPREARELITKSNLFGVVDWHGMRVDGLQAAAGFLIDRVYAAIAQQPDQDAPQARQDYTVALQTLRDQLEACRTVGEVVAALAELREELEGIKLTAEEQIEVGDLRAQTRTLVEERRELEQVSDAAYQAMNEAAAEHCAIKRGLESRERRGWKVSTEHLEGQKEAKALEDQRRAEWIATREGSAKARREEIRDAETALGKHVRSIYAAALVRNQAENPFHRGLNLMGERLIKVVLYRSTKGSEAFARHVTAATTGLIADWSWLEAEVTRAPRVTKESVRFQFRIAENFERVGGRTVVPDSTAELKEMFQLRNVQSGHWVQRDFASAKFHTEQTAAAFADLADLIGIEDRAVSHGGRLAMAFGARGKGATGAKGGAPSAHYETVHRVINVTKERGGGSAGHEWFHSLDDLIVEVVTGNPGVVQFATMSPDMLPAGELRDAFHALCYAMTTGTQRATRILVYTAKDAELAAKNVVPGKGGKIPSLIRNAGNLSAALQGLEQHFRVQPGEVPVGRNKSNYLGWRRIAIAFYGGNPDGGEIEVQTGPTMSSFKAEAVKLDGKGKPYFTEIYEMAARAFQSWIEDRLAEQGRRNDYLSVFADNAFYVDPLTGTNWKPYPEGEERKRINAAFDQLAAALRKHLYP
ncbi:LPD1 domain-containing protein [Paraburkholderia sp. J8-2]|uniref:LPD1 domain-containing protein n=1 Tax=Paraburkholderia sp. J8-2 TaxID=2805440 RepID=UPI002AB5EF79|nr:LPD1 domain-containing protein [Paraburkholderia sp. J8-2]